jgi:hypothetical protein
MHALKSVSVVVHIINLQRIAFFEAESDPPIPRHPDSPMSLENALQRMEERTGKIHISGIHSRAQKVQDIDELSGMGWLYASAIAGFEQQPQSLVPETPDHLLRV